MIGAAYERMRGVCQGVWEAAGMETELNGCPFCGSTCLTEDFGEEGWYVECNGCFARGPAEPSQEEVNDYGD